MIDSRLWFFMIIATGVSDVSGTFGKEEAKITDFFVTRW